MKRPNITPGPWHHSKGVSPAINTQLERTPINIARTIYGSYDEALANARAIAAVPELLAALEEAQELIKTARQYFPKSFKNADRFKLELTSASVSKALTKAGYEFP